jgi:hypothetical protein
LAKEAVWGAQTHLWLIKLWFSASIPIAIGMVKIANFAKPENVKVHLNDNQIPNK